jgi:hypothetical protein
MVSKLSTNNIYDKIINCKNKVEAKKAVQEKLIDHLESLENNVL